MESLFFKFTKEIISIVFTVIISFGLAVLIQSQVIACNQVQQSSMEDTLIESDRLIVDKISYRLTSPKKGDIIIFLDENTLHGFSKTRLGITLNDYYNLFTRKEQQKRMVKRIIGTPGDTVDIKEGKVYVNGEVLNETYTKTGTNARSIKFPLTVPENKLLVFGDNRNVSYDSRDYGLIDISNVEGKAIFRFWPLNKFGLIN